MEMIDETEIRGLAEYLIRTRGSEARDFVEGRIEESDRSAEWVRVAEMMDEILGVERPVTAMPRRA
jgi:hypothetical protein